MTQVLAIILEWKGMSFKSLTSRLSDIKTSKFLLWNIHKFLIGTITYRWALYWLTRRKTTKNSGYFSAALDNEFYH